MKRKISEIIELANSYYAKHGRSEKFIELENRVIASKNARLIFQFALEVKGANIPALKSAIIETSNTKYIDKFSFEIEDANKPESESKLITRIKVADNSTPTKPLTKDERMLYIAQAKAGDKNALDIIIRHSTGLIGVVMKENINLIDFALKQYSNVLEFDDFESAGYLGLMEAVQNFDAEKGQFSTYACMRIKWNFINLINKTAKHENGTTSLYKPLAKGEDGDEFTLLNKISETIEDPNDTALDYVCLQEIKKAIHTILSEKQYKVISLRFGLKDNIRYNLSEIAEMMNVSKMAIDKIEKQAISALQKHLKIHQSGI